MPKGAKTRPTKDRVREALFGIIGGLVCEATVLDVFAGSGAFGIEAVSRGARRAVFVEKDPRCVAAIKDNLKSLGIEDDAASVIKMDAFWAIEFLEKRREKFDLVFLDPPYYEGLAKKCLIKIDAHDILNPRCVVIAEHHKRNLLSDDFKHITPCRTASYGDISLTFYQARGNNEKNSGLCRKF